VKKLLFGFLIVLALLVGAILVVPGFIDWTKYKAEIAERIGALTGRAVVLNGDIDLALLPRPTLTVSGVRVANLPGASEPDLVRLKQLDVRVAFLPLLSGRIQVQSVTLVEPVIAPEVLRDGRRTWELSPGDLQTGAGSPSHGFADAIRFDGVHIAGGTVIYRNHVTGTVERFEAVHADLIAGSLVGPFQIAGRFTARGVPLEAELSAGRVGEGGAMPMRLSVRLPDDEAVLRFAGIVMTDGPARLQGDLRAEGPDMRGPTAAALRAAGEAPAGDMPPVLGQSFNLRTAIAASATSVDLNGIDLQIGETRGTGSVKYLPGTPARADLALSFNRFDLDSWLAVAATTPGPHETALALRLPADIDARLSLAVDALAYNGNVVRQGRLDAKLDSGVLNIHRFGALLPGGADVAASGTVAAEQGVPVLGLAVEGNADNLRALLDWLGLRIDAVPADRLRRATLSAQLSGRPDDFRVAGLDLQVDTTHLTGGIAYADRGRPGFGIRLDIDRLNLDGYLPQWTGVTDTGEPVATDLDRRLSDLASWLGDFDANVEAEIGVLTAAGTALQQITLDATVNNGSLTLRRFHSPDMAGVVVGLEGRVGRLASLDDLDLTVKLEAASLAAAGRAMGLTLPLPPERLGPVAVDGRIAGDPERLALELKLAAADGSIEAGGTLSQIRTESNWDLKVRATWPDALKLLGLFAPDYRPAAADPGAFDLYAEVAGSPSALSLSAVQGMVGPVSVQGEATVDLAGERPEIVADIQTGVLPVDAFRPASGRARLLPGLAAEIGQPWPTEPFDHGWLHAVDGRLALTSRAILWDGWRLDEPALQASLKDGVLILKQLDGEVMGGRIGLSGLLAAPPGADAVPRASARLTAVGVRPGGASPPAAGERISGFGLTEGMADIEADLSTTGGSAAAMIAALSGTGSLGVRDGTLTGIDLAQAAERLSAEGTPRERLDGLTRALSGGQTGFRRLYGTMKVDHGVMRTDDLTLMSDAGEILAAGTVDLPRRLLDLLLKVRLAGTEGAPEPEIALQGPIDRPQRTLNAEALKERLTNRPAQ
jgi:uncharacterized protein involved in outer membrane biogenesis